jgi:hypothetical protein
MGAAGESSAKGRYEGPISMQAGQVDKRGLGTIAIEADLEFFRHRLKTDKAGYLIVAKEPWLQSSTADTWKLKS